MALLARFNIPVTKVDEEKRLVYGLITEQVLDQAGEIMDYDSSKQYFEAWSAKFSAQTDGASLGNLRLMHQPVVAGKVIEIIFDDVLKQISCVAKVVSDEAWKLVLEGCLTGFSIGGKYVKRWKDAANKAISWFTVRPVEVSLVDNPCVETATFEFVKADGSRELRKFHSAGDGEGEDHMLTEEQIAAKAAELAKAAGTPDAIDQFLVEAETLLKGEMEAAAAAAPPVEEEEPAPAEEEPAPVEAAPAEEEPTDETKEAAAEAEPTDEERIAAANKLVQDQAWVAPDGERFAKKADAVAHVLANPNAAPAPAETAVEKALRLARGAAEPAPAELQTILDDLTKAQDDYDVAVAEIAPLTKSMYEVRSLSSVITDLRYVISSLASPYENQPEGSGQIAAALLGHLKGLAANLVTLTQEEVAAMIASLGTTYPTILGTVENAAVAEMTKADGPIMQKVGARNSTADQARIQVTHDSAVLLGATCECDTGKTVIADIAEEEILEHPVVKAMMEDRTRLEGEVEKAVGGIATLGEEMTTLRAQVEKFGKSPQPLPPLTDHVVVERMGRSDTINQETIEKMSPDERADLAIRLSQAAPQQMLPK